MRPADSPVLTDSGHTVVDTILCCMDVMRASTHHWFVRVLPHIKRLEDCFGDFLVRVVCECGACREIQPQALARLVGWKMTLKELCAVDALLEMRKESCRGDRGCATQAARYAEESALALVETMAARRS